MNLVVLVSIIAKVCSTSGWRHDNGRVQIPLEGGRMQDITSQLFS
ncbi:hypothetical protein DB30_03060 [Enhygromyxa salina]|uniref:Uncharacterized protein n=1 Tax=Enhygromyxa salina TaxID=215803 RepID=A0A0C1ZJA5_9BACT|nr:hypothetical protein DB30_03060 [Enhygromyxa salina]